MRKQPILLLVLAFALLWSGEASAARGEIRYLPLAPDRERVAWFVKGSGLTGVAIPSLFGQGFATDAQVRQYVGTPRYQVLGCGGEASARSVDIRVQRPDFDHTTVLDQVLRRAVIQVWQQCPIPYDIAFAARTHDLDIGRLRIFLPNGELVFEASNLVGDNKGQVLSENRRVYDYRYQWQTWINYPATAREQAAKAVAAAANEQEDRRAGKKAWGRVWLIVFGLLALWAWFKRETLLYWYYSLTPHPANGMVEDAISSGEELNGPAFAASVQSASGDSEVEKRVRADQARALTERWRKSEAAIKAEEARVMAEARREAEKNNVVLKAQKDLLDAAIAHEKAAARLDELRKRGK